MGSKWKSVLLGELCNEITVGFVGSMTQEYIESGIPFLRSKNISEYEVNWKDMKYVSPAFHKKLSKSALKPGDVAIVRTGKPGTTCVIPNGLLEANCSDIVIARVNDKLLCPHYLSYFMNAMAHGQINAHVVGAVQQHFNVGSAKKIEIPLPPRVIQTQIVNVLKTIDDKRRINTRTNQTLEQMAQTLFKSWFVDFDPVFDNLLAKADFKLENLTSDFPEALLKRAEIRLFSLNSKEHEKAKVALTSPEQSQVNIHKHFPSEFEHNEKLGWIPKGWEVGALYDLAEYINGAAYKKFEPNNDKLGLPIIKIAELKSGVSENTGFSTVLMPDKYKVNDNDILFSWSGNPDTSIDTFEWSLGEAWLNQHIFKVVPNKRYERDFIFCLLKDMKPVFADIARDKQTTGLGHVTVKDLKRLQIIMPKKDIIEAFNQEVSKLLQKQFIQTKQNQQLTKLRDTLLPKLISGELQIPDVKNADEKTA